MRHKTFFWFFLPTASAMLLFIAFPIISVITQSVHAPHKAVLIEVETCTPLTGCKIQTTIDQEATRKQKEVNPLGRFVGLDIFFDRGHLAIHELVEIYKSSENWSSKYNQIFNLPFYRAMGFTITFTFLVTPFVVLLGLWVYANKDLPKWENSEGSNEWIVFIPLYISALLLWGFIIWVFMGSPSPPQY